MLLDVILISIHVIKGEEYCDWRVLSSQVSIQKVEKLFMDLHTSCWISHPVDDVQLTSRQRTDVENKLGKKSLHNSSCDRASRPNFFPVLLGNRMTLWICLSWHWSQAWADNPRGLLRNPTHCVVPFSMHPTYKPTYPTAWPHSPSSHWALCNDHSPGALR